MTYASGSLLDKIQSHLDSEECFCYGKKNHSGRKSIGMVICYECFRKADKRIKAVLTQYSRGEKNIRDVDFQDVFEELEVENR